MRLIALLLLTLVTTDVLFAQRRKPFSKDFQFSIVPGLGTNGLHPGGYTNTFSINLTSGYSAATRLFEFATISNLNTEKTNGLQIAGIANITGGNAYAGMLIKEQDRKKREGFEANLVGAQFSGLTNIVLTNGFGWQTAGGANVVKGALLGLQISGIGNVVYKYTFGVQVGGLFNVSHQSMDGVQIAGLINYTDGGLYGVQIGVYNRIGFSEGKNSFENNDPTGVQIGLVNVAKQMNGFQIGLINKAKRSQGTQIGLINIYRGGKTTGTKDGTAIGLINLGDAGYLSVYVNELFLSNVEFATGNRKNARVSSDVRNVYIENALIYSNDMGLIDGDRQRWAFGYGLKKFFFNRSSTPGMMNFRFISYGVELLHINEYAGKITRSLNLVTRPIFSVGTRLHPKLRSIYVFGSAAFNAFWTRHDGSFAPSFLEATTSVGKQQLQMWPGFSAGIFLK